MGRVVSPNRQLSGKSRMSTQRHSWLTEKTTVRKMSEEKKWNVEVTREDVMMIEAKLRTPLSDSEHATWKKFQHIYHSSP